VFVFGEGGWWAGCVWFFFFLVGFFFFLFCFGGGVGVAVGLGVVGRGWGVLCLFGFFFFYFFGLFLGGGGFFFCWCWGFLVGVGGVCWVVFGLFFFFCFCFGGGVVLGWGCEGVCCGVLSGFGRGLVVVCLVFFCLMIGYPNFFKNSFPSLFMVTTPTLQLSSTYLPQVDFVNPTQTFLYCPFFSIRL